MNVDGGPSQFLRPAASSSDIDEKTPTPLDNVALWGLPRVYHLNDNNDVLDETSFTRCPGGNHQQRTLYDWTFR